MSGRPAAFTTVFRRELVTVARTPAYALLVVGLLIVVGGLVAVGGGGATGFVPAVVDLLLATEVLVPLAAVVLGYRALRTDRATGELAVIRTFGVGAVTYVGGILAARLLALIVVVGLPYVLVGGYVWATASPDTGIYATHTGVDSPLLYVRFLTFAVLLGAAYLAVAAGLSALAGSRRGAIALGGLVLAGGVLGGDLAVLRSLSTGTPAAALPDLLALTSNGAFRGLVFDHVIGVAFEGDGPTVNAGRALLALFGWSVAGAMIAVVALGYGRAVTVTLERVRRRVVA
ncbi:copper ABC transporter permease [Halorubrum vacuolatum]|uniref:Copper ABC transporter permease n=1 Tax=Halorubrum vacuolatum TaxID=63740 RepID=A0A238UWT3_HALVU|nr:copper ABC transporter permease [Halorubrum vacuolatum]SNR26314.1 hypothetical protein SAMN06264855_101471 [Halorubrum vacuolatum]